MADIKGLTTITNKLLQVYSALPATAKKYTWIVKGGNILFGQGTKAVLIDWSHSEGGSIELDIVTHDDLFEALIISVTVQNPILNPKKQLLKKLKRYSWD